jgi:acyl-CoA hydrolase
MQPKKPSQSMVESRYILMPDQASHYGTAFGGVIVAWMDMIAAMAAQRHCGKEVVTAGIDSIIFKRPINVGDHVIIQACVNYAGRTSMEVGVRVIREDPRTDEQMITTTAHLTFVALDENKRPTDVPKILPETDNEKRRYENAKIRVGHRKELLNKLKQQNS